MADITWVDVIDSAVKIGLGAIIGGVATYITTKTAHDYDSHKEYIKRRRDMLDRIVKDLDGFAQDLMIYWAVVRNALYQRTANQRVSDKDIEDIGTKEGELFNAFKDLATVESRLLLLGEKKLSEELSEYVKCADEFFKKSHYENPELTAEKMDEYRSKLKAMRQSLILNLSKTYRSIKEPEEIKDESDS